MKAAHRIHKWDRPPLYTIFFSTSPLPFFLSLVHDTVIGKRGRDVDLTGWLSLSGSFCSQPPWTEFQGGDPRCLLKLMKRPSLLVAGRPRVAAEMVAKLCEEQEEGSATGPTAKVHQLSLVTKPGLCHHALG